MKTRKRKLRSHVRRRRMVKRVRFGVSILAASMLAVGLRVAAVADDLPDISAAGAATGQPHGTGDRAAGGSMLTASDAAANASVKGVGLSARGLSGGSSAFEDAKFTRRFYVGLGGGLTRVEPRSRAAGLSVGDEESQGFHLFAGYDFSRWISAEIYAADLGAAQIDFLGTDIGDVDYQVYGASVIAYLLNSQSGTSLGNREDGLFRREGLSLYARAGVGGMRNDSDLDYERDHTAHLALGGGVEYGFSNGLALRAELMAFDTDARYGALSVLKRFGSVPVPVAPVPVVKPVVEPRKAPSAPPPPPPVVLAETEFTYFAFDKSELQPDAIAKLDGLVSELTGGDAALEVAGHTDSIGTEEYNLGLSRRRAEAVQSYLVSRGVAADRLNIEAFGETRPVADNATEEGRATNRRVEISRR